MIWFNLKKLETQLQKGELSSKHLFIYFLIYVFFVGYISQIFPDNSAGDNSAGDKWMADIGLIIEITITISFLIQFYQGCKAFDQESEFLKYYFSLGLVVGIRFLVFMMLLMIPVMLVLMLLSLYDADNPNPLIELMIGIVAQFIYFFMLLRAFNRVTEGSVITANS